MLRVWCCVLAPLVVVGCASFPRRMDYVVQRSAAMNGVSMSYAVYTPPDFAPDEVLPLVTFLHGAGDGPDAFDRHGISQRLDRAMRGGDVPRAVVVLPDGGVGLWTNWDDETRRYEDWVVDELIPEIASAYHTAPCPAGCHVMGVSMGGLGALWFALHRPDRFSSVTAISGPVLDTEQMLGFITSRSYAMVIPIDRIFDPPQSRTRFKADDLFLRWTSRERTGMCGIVLAWGNADLGTIRRAGRAFTRHLVAHSIPHEAWEYEGGHAWASWAPVIERALRAQLTPAGGRRCGGAS